MKQLDCNTLGSKPTLVGNQWQNKLTHPLWWVEEKNLVDVFIYTCISWFSCTCDLCEQSVAENNTGGGHVCAAVEKMSLYINFAMTLPLEVTNTPQQQNSWIRAGSVLLFDGCSWETNRDTPRSGKYAYNIGAWNSLILMSLRQIVFNCIMYSEHLQSFYVQFLMCCYSVSRNNSQKSWSQNLSFKWDF